MAAATLNVLRFLAGEHPCAVAAGTVRAFRRPDPATAHVATLLHSTPAASTSDRRDLLLAMGDRERSLAVDGPVELVQLRRDDVLPAPRLMAATLVPVVGFARLNGDERLLLLLDVEHLIQQLHPSDSTLEVTAT